MNEFNVGDKVTCIDSTYYENDITLGKQYEVLDISSSGIFITNNLGKRVFYYSGRFKKFKDIEVTYNIISALGFPIGSEFEVYDKSGTKDQQTIKVDHTGKEDIANKRLMWSEGDFVIVDDYISKAILKLIHRETFDFFKAIELIKQGKKVTNEFLNKEYYYLNDNGDITYSNGDINLDDEIINCKWYEVL